MANTNIIIKRDGSQQDCDIKKIFKRILILSEKHPCLNNVDVNKLSLKIYEDLGQKMTSQRLDTFMAEHTAQMCVQHVDYGKLAARIMVSNIHKITNGWTSYSETTQKLKEVTHPSTGKQCSVISEEYYNNVMKNAKQLNAAINYDLDYNYSYIGLLTLQHSYLMKINITNTQKKENDTILIERPQDMLMRTAVGIHGSNTDAAIETYNLMSRQVFTHASPTLFNSGTNRPQLSSCFLLGLTNDTLKEMFINIFTDTLLISAMSGGVGVHMHEIRAKSSPISCCGGSHPGIMSYLQVFNAMTRCVSQGGNKRQGAVAVYMPMWHPDIVDIIECRKNNGNDLLRTRDLFPAVWVSNLFFERVEKNEMWSLMCPNECPGLSDVYGQEFKNLYEKYEKEGKVRISIEARKLLHNLASAKLETGTPFICFKDTINYRSNHANIGTIRSSNLCTEIVQYSDNKQTAVCNLASVAVSKFIRRSLISPRDMYFDFEELRRVVKVITRNLDKVIDVTAYPTINAKHSNETTRPMGIGVQGLADLFIGMRIPFESDEASLLNKRVFETIYYSALEASCEMAQEKSPYPKYEGSPISKGLLQFDMIPKFDKSQLTHNWGDLKLKIKKHGVRNSMFVATMPTASTAQILGNAESTEPYMSNIFNRNILSGTCQVVNESLVNDLMNLGIWTKKISDRIILDGGSVQKLDIPQELKNLYKTTWEIKQKTLIDMAIGRGAFVDQAQSLNLYMDKPLIDKFIKMVMYCWKNGIKTMYYLRTKPATNPANLTIDTYTNVPKIKHEGESENEVDKTLCSLQNPKNCEMCSG
uniref:Ribonucleoside-diphosphate reductase n=1 Tax=Pasiphaea japonica whispovirus TaxID=2984286 RepID=A0A9C7BP15_9VIRU|nr:MAG: wsv172-like protein [Pasiphaea japonica whispovirus]